MVYGFFRGVALKTFHLNLLLERKKKKSGKVLAKIIFAAAGYAFVLVAYHSENRYKGKFL